MGINALKARAYELAGVSSTQQLKARYQAIGNLDLRLKSSWQQAVTLLESKPAADLTSAKSMTALKTQVYALAEVSTTRELKRKYPALGVLHFSYRSSWQTALTLLQTYQPTFQAWLENPPEEYKALFAEIDSVSAAFDTTLEQAQRLGQNALQRVKDLEQLTQHAQVEAEDLKQEAEAAARIAQRADLN